MIISAIATLLFATYAFLRWNFSRQEARVDNYFRLLGFTEEEIDVRRRATLDRVGSLL